MAWEKHGERSYYYRSVRRDGKVMKLYYGAGPTGRLAAGVDAMQRAERKAEAEALRMREDRLEVALALTLDLTRGCDLLAAATLLAAGFHRPSRHQWRSWRNGREALKHDPA